MAMVAKARPELLALLQAALVEPIGLLIASSDPARLRQQLYATRAASQETAFANLQFRMSPFGDGGLVIVKGPAPVSNLAVQPPNPADLFKEFE